MVQIEMPRSVAEWVIRESVERLGGPCETPDCERCAPRRVARAAFDAALEFDDE